jgi:hypothetical protein
MTYKELAEYISNLTEEQQNQDVTIFVSGVDEYYPLVGGTLVLLIPIFTSKCISTNVIARKLSGLVFLFEN